MTQNEKIAEVMGWDCDAVGFISPKTGFVGLFSDIGKDTPYGNWLAKKLQAKMVADGWQLQIDILKQKPHFFVYGSLNINEKHIHKIADAEAYTESAAIFELFCKIYGITDEA